MDGMASVWYLIPLVLAVVVYWQRHQLRRPIVWGGSLSWPILLIKPFVSVGFFYQLTTSELVWFFVSRAAFTFGLGALAAAIYETYLTHHFTREKKSNRHHLFFLSIGPLVFLILFLTAGTPFITSLILGIVANLVAVLIIRRDLVWDAAFSGVFFAVLYGLVFIFAFNSIPGDTTHLWFTDTFSGLTWFGLPIEELAVASLFGVLWAPLYIALKGLREKE